MMFSWNTNQKCFSRKTALPNPVELCSAQCPSQGAIAKFLSADCSSDQVLKIPEEELVHWYRCRGRGSLLASGNSAVVLLGKAR